MKIIFLIIILSKETKNSRLKPIQGWIRDIGIDGPTFVPKIANFTNLGQGLSQKVGFFLIFFEPILRAGFFEKNVSSFKQENHGPFSCCIFTTLFRYYLKGRFFTKKAP